MGICLSCTTVSDENLRHMLADPPLIWQLLAPEEPSLYLEALQASNAPSLLGRLLGRKPPKTEPRDLDFSEHERRSIDLDKSWDGITFCLRALCGSADDFLTSGQPIGRIDVGYGPALSQQASAVAKLATAFHAISDEDVRRSFHDTNFANAYLSDFWSRKDADAENYLLAYWAVLRSFITQASHDNMGVVMHYW